MSLRELLKVNGSIEENKPLSPLTWFKVGGNAELYYVPSSNMDLQLFFQQLPLNVPVTVVGNLSNILIRDGGVKGVVIDLNNPNFNEIAIRGTKIEVGAGVINKKLCYQARGAGLSGLEFLCLIPGTIGGGIKMNAGAYGHEVKDVLDSCVIMDRNGAVTQLKATDIDFAYRFSSIADNMIILSAVFKTKLETVEKVDEIMEKMNAEKKKTQPIRERTGGSTFRNPPGESAWKLIDKAGLRGFSIGGAKISEQHTNFIINFNNATAKDIETLIEFVQAKVYENSKIMLKPEIKIIGEK